MAGVAVLNVAVADLHALVLLAGMALSAATQRALAAAICIGLSIMYSARGQRLHAHGCATLLLSLHGPLQQLQ